MSITSNQIQVIQIKMKDQFSSREERLHFVSTFLNRKVATTKDLTSIEAIELIHYLDTGDYKKSNWGYFDKDKFPSERKLLWSYLHQCDWTVENTTHGNVPDTERLSDFLKSNKSPVNKPLKSFDKNDWEKVLLVFEMIVKHSNK